MQKHRAWVALGFLLVAAAFFRYGGTAALANDNLPGSAEDPLVTKSFVEDRVTFSLVEIPEGGRLIAGAGTEMIVRAGEALAIDSFSGGLSDVTSGQDLKGGEIVLKNHLLIVPRDDGRGLLASSPALVLVRGNYRID